MEVRPLSRDDIITALYWRNQHPETTRTAFMLNGDQQLQYYEQVICDRDSDTRYVGFWDEVKNVYPEDHVLYGPETLDAFVAYGGIENIEWENSRGEVSLIVNPKYQKKGYGKKCVNLILKMAFGQLNLNSIYGECYEGGSPDFWKHTLSDWIKDNTDYKVYFTKLCKTKYYNGRYWDSLYFSVWSKDE